jgi:hypothetical protein
MKVRLELHPRTVQLQSHQIATGALRGVGGFGSGADDRIVDSHAAPKVNVALKTAKSPLNRREPPAAPSSVPTV